jgi:enterochelin esterase family protein
MIVVITNGNYANTCRPLDRPVAMQNKIPAGIGSMASEVEKVWLMTIPYVEKNYRVIANADHRAITGFSMGGFQTQNITNTQPYAL